MNFENIFVPYLVGVNLFTCLLFAWDKNCAYRRKGRVPEKVLIACCAAYGASGGLLGMWMFRHKSQKPKFRILVPLFAILQIGILVLAYVY